MIGPSLGALTTTKPAHSMAPCAWVAPVSVHLRARLSALSAHPPPPWRCARVSHGPSRACPLGR
eukprot:14160233-Alexandrium_andersonii.AAC.1